MKKLDETNQTAENVLCMLLANSGIPTNNYYTSNDDEVEDAMAGIVLVTKHEGEIENAFRITVTKEMHFDSCNEIPVA